MKEYSVVISHDAFLDLQSIYEYIRYSLLSPDTAQNIYERITNQILILNQMPERFKLLETEIENKRGIHRMNLDNYAVFYIIKDQTVIVTNVLYGSSDIIQRLKL